MVDKTGAPAAIILALSGNLPVYSLFRLKILLFDIVFCIAITTHERNMARVGFQHFRALFLFVEPGALPVVIFFTQTSNLPLKQ
jgi:hypothetical protein